ncbi:MULTISPECIES: chemotaxis protein CheW [unclassified Moorena]|uniref:chemotaxis protein CheW n=1 Tax=unclassified Moorena TaxID=2683338 RepID=UPI001401B185|nr:MULTISPECIES: chemotaxis protein CheW [unclassified Moorena]NEO15991.1 hypothetical protein [Moorena sp. SIO3E8]NEQ02495.1 hypothetical protein [Moorena sp. SIO3F7]
MLNNFQLDKLIVFKIAEYSLCLPIIDVIKVVNLTTEISREMKTMGLVQLGKHSIKIWDLHQQLGDGSLPDRSPKQRFLVIIRPRDSELWGIFVDDLPNVVELPEDMMRPIPKSYRQASVLEMISHAAVIPNEASTQKIFLLDLQQVGALTP